MGGYDELDMGGYDEFDMEGEDMGGYDEFDMEGEDMGGYDEFDMEDEDEILYELEVDTMGDEGLGEGDYMMEFEDESEMGDEGLGEGDYMMEFENELDEMYLEGDMTYEGESWDDIRDETDQIFGESKGFKYNKKPNQAGFNPKMKEGQKRHGKSGKAKFDYSNEDPNSEIVMKIVNKIKGGKKSETKEASRTYGNGSKSGRGHRKGITPNRNLTFENIEEVETLREKNEEYRKALDLFRTKLNEVAVFNSNLAYATRLFTEHSTTKQEKINILRRFDNVESLKESKSLYRSLKNELATNTLSENTITESFNRNVMRTPSNGSSTNLIESKTYENPQFVRMKDLMNKLN
jgi:hypothetical protein